MKLTEIILNMSHIETDPKKICIALINEVKITSVYDPVKDTTRFSFEFPTWLTKNYTQETVKYLIDKVTPLLVESFDSSTQKKCFKIEKENC